MDENIMQLVTEIDDLVDNHAEIRGDNTAFDAIGALAYFSGLLLSQAPDQETANEAHRFFVHMLNEGLTNHQVTRH